MYELCPLCFKNGIKTKIKAMQINAHEAVWLCESEKCTWPFGIEDFDFFPREVGTNWSYEWKSYKSMQPRILPELSMYTPPDTPGHDISCKELTTMDTSYHTLDSNTSNISAFTEGNYIHLDHIYATQENINLVNNNQSNKDSKVNKFLNLDELTDGRNSDVEVEGCFSSDNDKFIIISDPVIKTNEDICLEDDVLVLFPPPIEDSQIILSKQTKGVPKIRSIQKTKISGLNHVKKRTITTESKSLLRVQNTVEKSENCLGSTIQVKTMCLDGLPPITVQYEMGKSVKEKKMELNYDKRIVEMCHNVKFVIAQPSGSSHMEAKNYEKFSFEKIRGIRKDITMNDEPDVIEILNDNSLNISSSSSKEPKAVSDNATKIENRNLKEMLDDYSIEECQNVSQDIDNWLESLLL